MLNTRGAFVLSLLLACAGFSAAAQAALPDGFRPFFAVLTRYDDNVFRVSDEVAPEAVLGTSHTDDLIRTLLGGLGLELTPGRQSVSLRAQATRASYGRFDFLDHTGWNADLRWGLAIGPRLTGTLEGSRARQLESFTEFRAPELDLTDSESAQARLRYALTAGLGAGGRAAARRLTHGLDSRRSGDSRSDELGVFFDYRVASGNFLGVELDRQDFGSAGREFIAGSLSDTGFRQYRSSLVGHWSGGGRGSLDARGGYAWRRFDHVSERDTGGFFGRLDMDWALSGKTAFTLAVYREFSVVEELFASAVTNTGGLFNLNWRPTVRTGLRGYARYDQRKFGQDPGLVPGASLDMPTDVLRTCGATLSYAPAERVSLSLGYEYGRRNSDRESFGYTYDAINFNVQVTL